MVSAVIFNIVMFHPPFFHPTAFTNNYSQIFRQCDLLIKFKGETSNFKSQ